MSKTLEKQEAIDLLQRYGWIPDYPDAINEVKNSDKEFKVVIQEYQKFFGLEETGELNESTSESLGHRFCGTPDRAGGQCKWPMLRVTYAHKLAFSNLSAEDCDRAFKEACESWNRVCGIQLVPGGDFNTANIYAEAKRIDGRSGTLAYSYLPCNANSRSRMYQRYDTGESWYFNFLRQTIIHEVGHAIGLDHLSYGNIMAPSLNMSLSGLQAGDIREGVRRYGNPQPLPPTPPTNPPTPPNPEDPTVFGNIFVSGVKYEFVKAPINEVVGAYNFSGIPYILKKVQTDD